MVPQCLLIFALFKLWVIYFILHQGVFQAFLIILLINVLFLVQFLYLNCVSYLLYYIRPIAWCIFICFVNKSSMFNISEFVVVWLSN